MLRGDVFLEDFTADKIIDPKRLKFADKVEILVEEGIEKESRELNLSLSLHRIVLETKSGQHFTEKMYHSKGFPQQPMTIQDFIHKIEKCAPYAVRPFTRDKIEALEDRVTHFEDQKDVSSLATLFF
jgi:aconitate decarboxylase